MITKCFLKFLGTGTSCGIPAVGCSCEVCKSKELKNNRLRTAALIRVNDKNILIDSGPDLRQQLLRANVDHIDLVFITHCHYDHTEGIDELRTLFFKNRKSIPVFASRQTIDELEKRKDYMVRVEDYGKGLISSQIQLIELSGIEGVQETQGLKVSYFQYHQKSTEVFGFVIGNLAYITDIKSYRESIFEFLNSHSIDILIISVQSIEERSSHISMQQAIEFSRKTRVKKTYFTHISHDIDYDTVQKQLPSGFLIAYDNLEIEFTI